MMTKCAFPKLSAKWDLPFELIQQWFENQLKFGINRTIIIRQIINQLHDKSDIQNTLLCQDVLAIDCIVNNLFIWKQKQNYNSRYGYCWVEPKI